MGWKEAELLENVLQASHGGQAREGILGRENSLSKVIERKGAWPVK